MTLRVEGGARIDQNLRNFAKGADREIRLAFMELAREILRDAVVHAPMESGQLRESGRASVGGRLVAIGTDTGIDVIAPSKVGWSSDTLSIDVSFGVEHDRARTPIPRYRTTVRDKDGIVRQRTDKSYGTENDFLVAVWTHENLNKAVNWHTAGTGPKYLENALKKYASVLRPRVGEALLKATKEIRKL
jgi:hypothetical protein